MRGAFAIAGLMLMACGSTVIVGGAPDDETGDTSGAGASGSSTGSGTTTTGGCTAPQSGDCQSDADCPGTPCVAITECGFRVCASAPPEAVMCNVFADDECCESADCAQGRCHVEPWGPDCDVQLEFSRNVCAVDACQSDADCGSAPPTGLFICAPPGAFRNPVRACVYSECRNDLDCTAESGGICAPVQSSCCDEPEGLFCVYPSDGCRSDADCDEDTHCGIDSGRAWCMQSPSGCPI